MTSLVLETSCPCLISSGDSFIGLNERLVAPSEDDKRYGVGESEGRKVNGLICIQIKPQVKTISALCLSNLQKKKKQLFQEITCYENREKKHIQQLDTTLTLS